MLTHLRIQNYIIIDQLELDFSNGLTVITGETGAGKSIIIDALTLVLGDRADSSVVANSKDKCDLSACFTINKILAAQEWLQEQDFTADENQECIIRRVIHRDGKSKQSINGFPCTLQQLREFVLTLINIHSQNQHQLLVKRNFQRTLLDQFGLTEKLAEKVGNSYSAYQLQQKKLIELEKIQQNFEVQRDLLTFQIDEFEKLSLVENEYQQLDQEHKQLANAEHLIKNCQSALECLSESEVNAETLLYHAQQCLPNKEQHEKLTTVNTLINDAIVHVTEASSELRDFLDRLEVNPERLALIENRLSKLHALARKYQVTPSEVLSVQTRLTTELQELLQINQEVTSLKQQSEQLWQEFLATAKLLHDKRQATATKLSKVIQTSIQKLGMPGGRFSVNVTWQEDQPSIHGCDHIEFLISTNPGQDLQPLSKVASGGEMSRIALAIYVATAQKNTTPILVFDEVDVGIGGGTAAIVGELLKKLAQTAQILCITHLPQVAAFSDQHYCVQKKIHNKQTETSIKILSQQEKVEEIARMLGGITITERTLAHAQELVNAC